MSGAGAAGGLDALARGGAEGVGVNGQRLGQLALGEDLDRHALARAEAGGPQRLERHLGAGVEARLEVGDVDRLGVGAEHARTASTSSCAGRAACASACGSASGRPRSARGSLAPEREPYALLAAAGGLARARALAAADALARAAAARRRGRGAARSRSLLRRCARGSLRSVDLDQVADGVQHAAGLGVSLTSTVWPMRRSPSERSVSSWLVGAVARAPLGDRQSCAIRPAASSAARPSQPPSACGGRRRRLRPRRRPSWARRWPARLRARAPGRSTGRAARRPPRACAARAGRRRSP